MEGRSRPGYRCSGSLPSLALGPWETVKFESCEGARAREGLNVGPALSIYVYCKIVVESRSRRAKKQRQQPSHTKASTITNKIAKNVLDILHRPT